MRRIQRDDLVEVLSGKDRGKRGQVRQVIPRRERVIVQGVNMVKRHLKPRQLGTQAGIVEMEAPLHWSNVAPVCASCNRATRIGFRIRADAVKVRVCKRCDEELD